MQLFLSCHAMLLRKKWLFTFKLHFLSKLFYQPTEMTNYLSANFLWREWALFVWRCPDSGGIPLQGSVCFHKHGIKRLNFSKAKTEKHTWHWNCCLQNVQCLLKKAEAVNFPLLKYFFWQETADCHQISISIFIRTCHM